jgi:hypothetical protein
MREKFRSKNIVGIIVDKDTFNVISGYTSRVRLAEHLKVKVLERFRRLMSGYTTRRKYFSRRGSKWACRECIKRF